jgi:hypothetical protein
MTEADIVIDLIDFDRAVFECRRCKAEISVVVLGNTGPSTQCAACGDDLPGFREFVLLLRRLLEFRENGVVVRLKTRATLSGISLRPREEHPAITEGK